MIRSLLLLVALPMGSAVAQTSAIHLTLTSPNKAAFRIIGAGGDSVERPLIARGRIELVAEPPSARGMEVTAFDTTTAIHVEATQGGRVIASGDGVYLKIQRDTSGIAIESRSNIPPAVARTLRKPE